MAKRVVALFDDIVAAHRAVDSLVANGYRRSDVSLRSDPTVGLGEVPLRARMRALRPRFVALGASMGALIGGCFAALAGLYWYSVHVGQIASVFSMLVWIVPGVALGVAVGVALGLAASEGVFAESSSHHQHRYRTPGAVVVVDTVEGLADPTAQFLLRFGAVGASVGPSLRREPPAEPPDILGGPARQPA